MATGFVGIGFVIIFYSLFVNNNFFRIPTQPSDRIDPLTNHSPPVGLPLDSDIASHCS